MPAPFCAVSAQTGFTSVEIDPRRSISPIQYFRRVPNPHLHSVGLKFPMDSRVRESFLRAAPVVAHIVLAIDQESTHEALPVDRYDHR